MRRMTQEEAEAFLADSRVAVLSVASGPRTPFAVPIWYSYEPGGVVRIATNQGSRKAHLLDQAQRFNLTVHDDAWPYRYVSVEGPILSVRPVDIEDDWRPLAQRYLGDELGDEWVDLTFADGPGDSVLIEMKPQRWLSEDYGS